MPSHAGQDVAEGEHSSFITGASVNLYNHYVPVVVPQEVGDRFTSRSSYISLAHILEGCFLLLQRHLLSLVHGCSIQNSQKLKIDWMSISERMGKKNVVPLHNGIFLR